MITLKAVENTAAFIDKTLTDKAAELEQLKDLIAIENDSLASANKEIEAATAAGDLRAYQKAKGRRQDVLDALEMHESRLSFLNGEPLITREKYEQFISGIFAEVAGADDTVKQKLCQLSDSMNAAALELQDTINRANDVLRRLQHDIYRDADKTRNAKTGEVLPIEYETKAVRNFSTVNWGKIAAQSAQYEAYTRRKAAE